MGLDNKDILHSTTSEVLRLCAAYHAADATRVDLDRRLMTLPGGDYGRDVLWQELEATLVRLSSLASQLAAMPATQPVAMRAKAVVLASLLRFGNAHPSAIGLETTALALSLADEVAGLVI